MDAIRKERRRVCEGGKRYEIEEKRRRGCMYRINTTVELIYTLDKTSDQIPIFFMSIGF